MNNVIHSVAQSTNRDIDLTKFLDLLENNGNKNLAKVLRSRFTKYEEGMYDNPFSSKTRMCSSDSKCGFQMGILKSPVPYCGDEDNFSTDDKDCHC